MKRIAGLASLLLLFACTGGSHWTKDGVAPAAAAKDFSECNSLAESASRTDSHINQDILAARGKDWQDTGMMSTVQQNYSAQVQQKSQDIVFRCMVGKGYAPGA